MKVEEHYNKKLLVEGNDDQHVIWSICKEHSLPENFDVIDCMGIENLRKQLPIRFKTSDVETIGIIIDADTDMHSRWESIKSLINPAEYTIPSGFPADGLIITNHDGARKFGAWIMPDNNISGMLEDFIAFLIPASDQLLPIVDSTLNDIEKQKLAKYSPLHKSKAIIHTWLAWQESPGTPMGMSITKKYLNPRDVRCLNFIKWLENLFF